MQHPFRSLMFSLVLVATGSSASATDWLCALSDDGVRLVCMADADPAAEASAEPGLATTVRGTAFPLDRQRTYVVDLWTPPSEPDWVELLARSTICFRTPACSVTVAPSAWTARAPGKAVRLAGWATGVYPLQPAR